MFKKIILTASLFFIPVISFAYTYGSDNFYNVPCSASTDTGASYTCDKANDANTATFWQSTASSMPDWIKFTATSTINKLSIKTQDGPYIKDFQFQGSNDNTNWTTILSGTHGNNSNYEDFLATTNTTAFAWHRVYITSSWQNYGYDQSVIAQIEGYTCTDCGGTSTTSTASSTIGFMSPQLDFMLQLFIEALFVIMGLVAGYLVLKRLTKK